MQTSIFQLNQAKQKVKECENVLEFSKQFKSLELLSSSQRFRTLFSKYRLQDLEITEPLDIWVKNLLLKAETYEISLETSKDYQKVKIDIETGSGRNYNRREVWLRVSKPDFDFLILAEKKIIIRKGK